MQELTAFDISNLVKESQILTGGKINNLYQTDSKNLYLQIYANQSKHLLRIISGKAFFMTKNRPEFPENLQRFCAYLRKYLLNARIREIVQIDYERIIKIAFETKNGIFELIAELFGKGNIMLASNNKILSVIEEQIWADRILKAGEIYSYPKREDSKEMFEKQEQKGSNITMNVLDEEFLKTVQPKAATAKEKEIQRIRVIIEKQAEQMEKAAKEMEINKNKGELIYKHYAEIKEKMSKADKKERTLKVILE